MFYLDRHKTKKRTAIWKEKSKIFFDILKIEYILIIHKETSSIIGQKNIHNTWHEKGFISKIFQKIISYEYDNRKPQHLEFNIKKDLILLEYDDYKVLLEDGDFIRSILILNSDPSYYLQIALETLIKEYEKENQKFLKNFTRKITEYPDFMDLIDNIFDISLIFPHIIDLNTLSTVVNSYQDKILTIAANIQKKKGKFFISELLNQLISNKDFNEPKERIIANIFDLRQYGYIKPLEE